MKGIQTSFVALDNSLEVLRKVVVRGAEVKDLTHETTKKCLDYAGSFLARSIENAFKMYYGESHSKYTAGLRELIDGYFDRVCDIARLTFLMTKGRSYYNALTLMSMIKRGVADLDYFVHLFGIVLEDEEAEQDQEGQLRILETKVYDVIAKLAPAADLLEYVVASEVKNNPKLKDGLAEEIRNLIGTPISPPASVLLTGLLLVSSVFLHEYYAALLNALTAYAVGREDILNPEDPNARCVILASVKPGPKGKSIEVLTEAEFRERLKELTSKENTGILNPADAGAKERFDEILAETDDDTFDLSHFISQKSKDELPN